MTRSQISVLAFVGAAAVVAIATHKPAMPPEVVCNSLVDLQRFAEDMRLGEPIPPATEKLPVLYKLDKSGCAHIIANSDETDAIRVLPPTRRP